ncbi:hypothetical protein HGM15179_019174, partial [Zosterops borbonicus]
SSLPWFGWHVVVGIFLPFAGPYLNMDPKTKATVAVIQLVLWVDKVRNSWIFNFLWKANGTFCEEMTMGEVFSRPFNNFFAPTPPAFEGFKFPLDTNQVLLIILAYLAFRDKVRSTWITAQTPTSKTRDSATESDTAPETGNTAMGPDTAPQNRDAGPLPDPAPQPTSEMNHLDWVGVLVREIHEMGQVLKEYTSPAGGKPSSCPKREESDGAAVEPTDVTTVQVPAEPQGQSQPAPEVEIITESLTYESLHNLQKDIVRWGHEAYTAWLLWVWDLMGTGVQVDSGEARNLGPLTQDSGVNQVFVREPGPLSLWEWLLMSVRERFVHRDRMQEHHRTMHWKTLEEGIQKLREVAVLEVLFGRTGQHDNDPNKVKCTGKMWNLATHRPPQYTTFIRGYTPRAELWFYL